MLEQELDLFRRNGPNDVELHILVAMNDPVARADDISPGDTRVSLPELDGEARGSLAAERDRIEDRVLKQFISIEVLPGPARDEALQPAAGQDDVEHRRGITIHRSPWPC